MVGGKLYVPVTDNRLALALNHLPSGQMQFAPIESYNARLRQITEKANQVDVVGDHHIVLCSGSLPKQPPCACLLCRVKVICGFISK